ncbi:uncharacterized protein [Primulina huaijiensis]|uniref:uncharacterized protein n=1 Tax=Primulina huaijiensis TaxID=1492673 RepID=UPI003CC70C8C
MDEEEHEFYGEEILDEYADADVDMIVADNDTAANELDEMEKRLKEMEEKAAALRTLQAKVEKEMAIVQVVAECDDDRITLLLSEVEGKDITELIAAGREKLDFVTVGGGGGVAVAAAPTGCGGAPAKTRKEEKVEEKRSLMI